VAAKGVVHSPAPPKSEMSMVNRDALLAAIAKARLWIDDLAQGRVQSSAEIARREDRVARHIRLLAPLAFVPGFSIALLRSWA
jgi:site-specific DNA recombinase